MMWQRCCCCHDSVPTAGPRARQPTSGYFGHHLPQRLRLNLHALAALSTLQCLVVLLYLQWYSSSLQ